MQHITMSKKVKETSRLITKYFGVIFGFLLGVFVTFIYNSKIYQLNYIPSTLLPIGDRVQHRDISKENKSLDNSTTKFWDNSNPKGAERLPPGIVVSETDFYLRRLTGEPNEDVPKKQKYLVTFTVGFDQRKNIEEAMKKFSDDFTILLFHYDGRTNEWDEFEWSKRAIHVSARKQTKWWFAKRFLHPDIVAAYDYIFIWDEDLGVEHFDAEKYLEVVKKHGLEISQPGLVVNSGLTWEMTKRRGGREVHKKTNEIPGRCSDPLLPPCAAFIEIMAPVFSREAWRCVWYMIQNDLVHGWGLDYALRKCVQPEHEKIGVVDSQWIDHKRIPTLGSQVDISPSSGDAPKGGVRVRCKKEWKMFNDRLKQAEDDQLLKATQELSM